MQRVQRNQENISSVLSWETKVLFILQSNPCVWPALTPSQVKKKKCQFLESPLSDILHWLLPLTVFKAFLGLFSLIVVDKTWVFLPNRITLNSTTAAPMTFGSNFVSHRYYTKTRKPPHTLYSLRWKESSAIRNFSSVFERGKKRWWHFLTSLANIVIPLIYLSVSSKIYLLNPSLPT